MPSVLLTIVIVCLLAGLLFYGFKPYDYGGNKRSIRKIGAIGKIPEKSSDTRWRSVKIRPGLMSCKRVSTLAGQIFLAEEAPSLPLPNCAEEDCRCHYIFLEDRRSGADRRIEYGRFGDYASSHGSDRRLQTGRRYADQAA